MEDSVKVTYHHESRMVQIVVEEDRDKRSLWMKVDNWMKMLEDYNDKIDVSEFQPVDWEKEINPEDFKTVLKEEKIDDHRLLKCKINGCNIPVKKVRYFKEGEMEEPVLGDDSICLNQYGFHDHHTGIFWVFRHPRLVDEKRFSEEPVPLEDMIIKKKNV